MERIFGFDLGSTSVGWAVIESDGRGAAGRVVDMGVRIFPEARNEKDGAPLNQNRRMKRMARRQTRRRRKRKTDLAALLADHGLLPRRGTAAWDALMRRTDPVQLRAGGLVTALAPDDLGRVLYHLAGGRHFAARHDGDMDQPDAPEKEELEQAADREQLAAQIGPGRDYPTLGAYLADMPYRAEKKVPPTAALRNHHAYRHMIEAEFDLIWAAQERFGTVTAVQRDEIRAVIFFQRPVFWRKATLGHCPLMPDAALAQKGSWLSRQKTMLEKVNNLAVQDGNQRPLDGDERAAILAKLSSQDKMTEGGIRKALAPLFAARGEKGAEKKLHFNMTKGETLPGNKSEADFAKIFGADWANHPQAGEIRATFHTHLFDADYGTSADGKRVIIRPVAEQKALRAALIEKFQQLWSVTPAQATALSEIRLPGGWDRYATETLQRFLPLLEEGIRFGALINGPDYAGWREETFPDQEKSMTEGFGELPSPSKRHPEEQRRLRELRNPTVVRVQNELRKVVNNLIRLHGKPDRIRVELARDLGRSKRQREEDQKGIRDNEKRRSDAKKALVKLSGHDPRLSHLANPSRDDVLKYLLWEECGRECPYTGKPIGCVALFAEALFEVEHIWPRSRSFDDGQRNKTLCCRELNRNKNNQTPFEYFQTRDPAEWAAVQERLKRMSAKTGKTPGRMSPAKIRRFLADRLEEGFAARQLNDTGWAAREAVAMLSRLWPGRQGEEGVPIRVQAVSGRVTAHLGRLWGLHGLLGDTGEKTRSDHRHHAVDALEVACATPSVTQQLSRYFQQKDSPARLRPVLPVPWEGFRAQAQHALENLIVSHRVRRKVSGPLHEETVFGDTKQDFISRNESYRLLVTRKKVEELKGLWSKDPELDGEGIRDDAVRGLVQEWIEQHGGSPETAFQNGYPRHSPRSPEIRKVRILTKQRLPLLARVSGGLAKTGDNHHLALFQNEAGEYRYQVVSRFEAARRNAARVAVVDRAAFPGFTFVQSYASGEIVRFTEPDGRTDFFVVTSMFANGQLVLVRHTDARPTSDKEATKRRMTGARHEVLPRAWIVHRQGGGKWSVDPIGRAHRSQD